MPNEQPKPKQFHVEVVTVAAQGVNLEPLFARGIEEAYRRINDQCLLDGMVIVDRRDYLTNFRFVDGETSGLCFVITAQRISRKDLMAEQMRQQLSQPIGRPS